MYCCKIRIVQKTYFLVYVSEQCKCIKTLKVSSKNIFLWLYQQWKILSTQISQRAIIFHCSQWLCFLLFKIIPEIWYSWNKEHLISKCTWTDLNIILINPYRAYKIGSAERAFKWSSADTTSCSSDLLLEKEKSFIV